MGLTPLDIEHATFERAPFGYHPRSVRALLLRIAEEHEGALREIRRLREALHERDETIAGLREAEAELQRAVIAAERIASEMTENARESARLIEAEARAQADALRRAATADVAAAHGEVARLERSRAVVREQLRGQLTAFLRALDVVGADAEGPPNATAGPARPHPAGRPVEPARAPAATAPVATAPVATAPVATGPVATGPVATGPVGGTTGDVDDAWAIGEEDLLD